MMDSAGQTAYERWQGSTLNGRLVNAKQMFDEAIKQTKLVWVLHIEHVKTHEQYFNRVSKTAAVR